MKKINKLILCFIPTNLCNLKCEYCLVSQTNEWNRNDIKFQYPVEHIVQALSKERLGGECFINLTAPRFLFREKHFYTKILFH